MGSELIDQLIDQFIAAAPRTCPYEKTCKKQLQELFRRYPGVISIRRKPNTMELEYPRSLQDQVQADGLFCFASFERRVRGLGCFVVQTSQRDNIKKWHTNRAGETTYWKKGIEQKKRSHRLEDRDYRYWERKRKAHECESRRKKTSKKLMQLEPILWDFAFAPIDTQ